MGRRKGTLKSEVTENLKKLFQNEDLIGNETASWHTVWDLWKQQGEDFEEIQRIVWIKLWLLSIEEMVGLLGSSHKEYSNYCLYHDSPGEEILMKTVNNKEMLM